MRRQIQSNVWELQAPGRGLRSQDQPKTLGLEIKQREGAPTTKWMGL